MAATDLSDYRYDAVPSNEIAQVPANMVTEYNFEIRRERCANLGHTTIREAGAVLCSTHTPVPGAPSPGTFVADPVKEYSATGGLIPTGPRGRAKADVSFITQMTGAVSHPYTHNSAGRPDYSDATICNAPRSHQIWYSTHRQQLEQALANSTGAHTAYGTAHQGQGPGEFSPHALVNVETDIPAPRLSASQIPAEPGQKLHPLLRSQSELRRPQHSQLRRSSRHMVAYTGDHQS